jgi:hypothetical protein
MGLLLLPALLFICQAKSRATTKPLAMKKATRSSSARMAEGLSPVRASGEAVSLDAG